MSQDSWLPGAGGLLGGHEYSVATSFRPVATSGPVSDERHADSQIAVMPTIIAATFRERAMRLCRTTRLRRAGPTAPLETEARTRRCLQPMVRTETTTISFNNPEAHVFRSGSTSLRTRSLLREQRCRRNHEYTSKQSTTPNMPHSQINLTFRNRSHDHSQTD